MARSKGERNGTPPLSLSPLTHPPPPLRDSYLNGLREGELDNGLHDTCWVLGKRDTVLLEHAGDGSTELSIESIKSENILERTEHSIFWEVFHVAYYCNCLSNRVRVRDAAFMVKRAKLGEGSCELSESGSRELGFSFLREGRCVLGKELHLGLQIGIFDCEQ